MFIDCPEFMDIDSGTRCGLPAVIERRYAMQSTDGPLEAIQTRCPRGHLLNGPVESLTLDRS